MSSETELCIECEFTFLPESEGGPTAEFWPKKFNDYYYRPCLVVGDPNQREAILVSKDIEITLDDGSKTTIRHDKVIDEKYFGVAFKEGPTEPNIGEAFRATIVPIGGRTPESDELIPGATFTVREGARIVGYGTVIERQDS